MTHPNSAKKTIMLFLWPQHKLGDKSMFTEYSTKTSGMIIVNTERKMPRMRLSAVSEER